MQSINNNAISQYQDIANEARKRGIQYLVHFTRLENLLSICQNGLISRDKICQRRINGTLNDKHRLDGFTNAISLSVTFPNYKNFYSYRKNPSNNVTWIVLLLDAYQILANYYCLFNFTNAANKCMSSLLSTPVSF